MNVEKEYIENKPDFPIGNIYIILNQVRGLLTNLTYLQYLAENNLWCSEALLSRAVLN